MRYAAERAPTYTLVYDGDCAVCGRLVGLVGRWDRWGLIEQVPSERIELAARFPWLSQADYDRALQLVGPGGETWSGSAAVERLLRLLPHGWLAGWVFRLPFAGRATERVYRWVARNRYRFGCAEHCRTTAEVRPARRSDTSPGSPHGS